ncbi:MRPL54 [Auxenochlorella protothecoides x Auxenochlorella symbiontica]
MLARRALPVVTLCRLPRAFASLSTEVATGVNILKNGTDPALKSDEELPAWLWELAQPEKPLTELQRHEFTELQSEEQRRWVKLETRAGIKANNVLKSA